MIGVRILAENGIFLFDTVTRRAVKPTQPPVQWVPGALSLGVKRVGREADHSPSSLPMSKNVWSYTSTSQYVFIAWCSVKAEGQLYFTLLYLVSKSALPFRS
jgi:hypothetical protein